MTNSAAFDSDFGLIQGLTSFLSQLYGLPGYVLVCLSCIVVGYLFKLWKTFPNDAIPVVCVFWGMLFNPLIASSPAAGTPVRIWLVTHILVGMCIGCTAWIVHNKLLKRYETSFPIIGQAIADAATKPGNIK